MRTSLASDRVISAGMAAQAKLLASEVWQNSRTPALYFALPKEMPTRLLLESAWITGKTPLLPRILSLKEKRMAFFSCAGYADLERGTMGIMQPVAGMEMEPDLFITPGLAFSITGERLGYGGGFYDSYFTRNCHNASARVGFCFYWQIVRALPAEEWDCPVNALCSEKGFRWL